MTAKRRLAEIRCAAWEQASRAARRVADWAAARHTNAWRSMPRDDRRDRP